MWPLEAFISWIFQSARVDTLWQSWLYTWRDRFKRSCLFAEANKCEHTHLWSRDSCRHEQVQRCQTLLETFWENYLSRSVSQISEMAKTEIIMISLYQVFVWFKLQKFLGLSWIFHVWTLYSCLRFNNLNQPGGMWLCVRKFQCGSP